MILDELKKFLSHELEELKQNKIRAITLGVCFVMLLIFWATDDNSDSEEILIEEPPVTKDLPVKHLPVEKFPDGVKIVLGANADALFIGDPFAGEEKPKPQPPPPPTLPQIPKDISQVVVETPPPAAPKEQIILTGTAISGDNKIAMFLRGKETIFLLVGEEIDGKKILDITPEFVTFEGGKRVYLQKELN